MAEPEPFRGAPARVHLLREEVARKIAAGEVIDRPFSVLRELLDNAIDAGAGEIQSFIEAGGVSSMRVVDDGRGMSAADLELCYLPHATSKIETENDLLVVRSLGFRGEALSSIATVSRLEIVSSERDDGAAGKLTVHGGSFLGTEPWRGTRGTSVTVDDLFYALPARRKFLKSAGAESAQCRNTVVEKALAHPGVTFRYFVDGALKLFLPAVPNASTDYGEVGPGKSVRVAEAVLEAPAQAGSGLRVRRATVEAYRSRIIQLFPREIAPKFLHGIHGSADGVELHAVVGTPELHRRDRRYIQCFVNGRKIWEFAFVQAIEYAFSGFLPGGVFPVVFVFIDVEPHLVDFNIHPAKKEARFRNREEIHHLVSETVRTFLSGYVRRSNAFPEGDRRARSAGDQPELPDRWAAEPGTLTGGPSRRESVNGGFGTQSVGQPSRTSERGVPESRFTQGSRLDPRRILSGAADEPAVGPIGAGSVHYLGQIFSLFLVAEAAGSLYVVDQHAGHERLIYDELRSRRIVQKLLVPIEFMAEAAESAIIAKRRDELAQIGITLERSEDSSSEGKSGSQGWRVTAVPESLAHSEEALVDALRGVAGFRGEIEKDIYARVSCRSALMDGDPIDDAAALHILHGVFRLDNPRCPHGRPIWHRISRAELFEFVGRTV